MLIELTITAEADHLIPHNRGILPPSGPQDRLPKLLTPLKEHLCLLGGAQDLDPAVDLQALIQSAAPAAQAAAGVTFVLSNTFRSLFCDFKLFINLFFVTTVIQTAARVTGHVHALFSHQPPMHPLSLQWCWIQMSHAEALELKCKTYQCAPQVCFYVFDMPFKSFA